MGSIPHPEMGSTPPDHKTPTAPPTQGTPLSSTSETASLLPAAVERLKSAATTTGVGGDQPNTPEWKMARKKWRLAVDKVTPEDKPKILWSALDLGDLIKNTVQKAMVQKNGKGFIQLVYRNGHSQKNDLLQLIQDKILDSGQPLSAFHQIEITDEELAPYLNATELNTVDGRSQTALHLCVQYCSGTVVCKMLMAGANGLQREVDGLTPAHFAAIAGNLDTFRELPIASYTMSDHIASRAPIHYAALCGKMDILDYLLTEIMMDIDTPDGYGSTPLVLAALYGHPTVAEGLINRGACGDVANNAGVPAVTVVAQCYDSLGELILDKYKKYDEYENSITCNLEPLVKRDIGKTDMENGACRGNYSFYQVLVSTATGVTNHPVIKELTDKKWDLYAQKRFICILACLAFFNIFWTAIYIWPHAHGSNQSVMILGVCVMFLGGSGILMHMFTNAYVIFRKRKFANYVGNMYDEAYEFEKTSKHPLTENQFKHVKNEYKKSSKIRSFAPMMVVFFWKCIVDCLWLTFLGLRVQAFIAGDEHHMEEMEGGNGTEEELSEYAEGASLYLIGEYERYRDIPPSDNDMDPTLCGLCHLEDCGTICGLHPRGVLLWCCDSDFAVYRLKRTGLSRIPCLLVVCALTRPANTQEITKTLAVSDIVISLLLIMIWIQLFVAFAISKTVGRFVVFTREVVVKDVGQVFSVYVVLFIPMTAIFWKTIYSHSDGGQLSCLNLRFRPRLFSTET
eukprot:sb/3462425/